MTRSVAYSYQGGELDLFKHAVTWKRYYATCLQPHIRGDVLEVGAGVGGTSRFLFHQPVTSWTCLEPDGRLAADAQTALAANPFPVPSDVIVGTLSNLPPGRSFDTLLYIDVLEHIDDDRDELRQAAGHLRPDGRLIVLSPAHQWLFSPFDTAIGHVRRYTRRTLLAIAPPELAPVTAFYLDSVGMLVSLANRMVLRAATPTLSQIRFWDNRIIPISRRLDPLLAHRAGKSVVAVWRRV